MKNDQKPNTKGQGVPKARLNDSTPVREGDDSKANAAKKLSPEEQMARFEEDLKENDWGHQPC